MIDTAIILAAGRGTRLQEITRTRSKAMLPVAGKPMIARVIDSFVKAGISQFFIAVSPDDQEIRHYFARQPKVTLLDQNEPKGAGDALILFADCAPNNFIVSACDNIVEHGHILELLKTHQSQRAALTLSIMTVPETESLSSRSVVRAVDGVVQEIIEKPNPQQRISNTMSLPLYVLSRKIFPILMLEPPSPRGEFELQGAFQKLIRQGERVFAETVQSRLQVTNQADLLELNLHYLRQLSPGIQVDSSVTIPPTAKLIAPVLIEAGCSIAENVTLGPAVYLEQGVTVTAGSVLLNVVAIRNTKLHGVLSDKIIAT